MHLVDGFDGLPQAVPELTPCVNLVQKLELHTLQFDTLRARSSHTTTLSLVLPLSLENAREKEMLGQKLKLVCFFGALFII